MRQWMGMGAVISGVFWMVSCGAGGGGAPMGDLPAGDEPAEGGISDVPNPNAAMAKKTGKSLTRLQQGHEIYMLRCGECHTYQLPENLDVDEWEDVMPKMIRHAGLAADDEKAVLDYVIAVKSQQG